MSELCLKVCLIYMIHRNVVLVNMSVRLGSLVNGFGRAAAVRTCKSCSAEPTSSRQSQFTSCRTIRRVLRRFFQPHTVECDLALTRVNNNLILRRNGSCAGPLTILPMALVNIASVWGCFCC